MLDTLKWFITSRIPGTRSNLHRRIELAAIDFVNLVTEHLQQNRGVHAETAVSAAASVAGVTLLRNTGMNFSMIKPGETVIVESLNEKGTELLSFASAVLGALGVNPETGWTEVIPKDNEPQVSSMDLARSLERPFLLACDLKDIPKDDRPKVAVFAAVKLITLTAGVMKPEIGKALLAWNLLQSSKTMPHPLET